MFFVIQIFIVVVLFGSTGFLLISLVSFIRQQFQDLVDRILLGLFTGAGFYTLLFILLNTTLKIKIDTVNILACFTFVCLPSLIYFVSKKPETPYQVTKTSDLNVLLITLDTTRADRIGCYGYEKAATPNMDQLAAEITMTGIRRRRILFLDFSPGAITGGISGSVSGRGAGLAISSF